MKTLQLIIIFSLFLFINEGIAQDKIYLKGSTEPILVDVIEIGLEAIKYKPYSDPDSPILNIDVANISKLILKDGQELTFKDPFNNPAMYADQKKNALKIGFLNPLLGSTQFSYERSLKPGQSIETVLGIIGLGWDPSETNPGGVTLKFGYKFIKTPDFQLRGMRYSHLLKGGYVKPEIIFNAFSYEGYTYDPNGSGGYEKQNTISGAIMINLGKQWVMSDSFLIDFYVGIGYGFTSSTEDYYDGLNYGFVGGLEDIPIAVAGGLRVGFLLK